MMEDNRPRRPDLPKRLHERERLLRKAIRRMERMFPPGTGLVLMAFDFGDQGHSSYISNAQREGMIKELEDLTARLRAGMDDTAGREA